MNLQIYCKNTIYFSDSQGKWGNNFGKLQLENVVRR